MCRLICIFVVRIWHKTGFVRFGQLLTCIHWKSSFSILLLDTRVSICCSSPSARPLRRSRATIMKSLSGGSYCSGFWTLIWKQEICHETYQSNQYLWSKAWMLKGTLLFQLNKHGYKIQSRVWGVYVCCGLRSILMPSASRRALNRETCVKQPFLNW